MKVARLRTSPKQKRFRRRVFGVPGLPGAKTIVSHSNTVGNAVRAARERVLGTVDDGVWQETIKPTADFAARLGIVRRQVLRKCNRRALPISVEEFALHYRGPKRKRYLTAMRNIDIRGICRRDADIRGFLKSEKWPEDKAGRVISPATPEYIAALGAYLQPIEHNIYRAFEFATGSEVIMKGYTQEKRAAVIAKHWGKFRNPVAIGLDASKFDQHVSAKALAFEHSFYQHIYFNDPQLSKLLSWQMRRNVSMVLDDGVVKWKADGGRMSGDINTALGNCILSATMLLSYARDRNVKVLIVVDGDDCVAFMEAADEARFRGGLKEWYLELGFRMKVEPSAYRLNDVEFCQSKMVHDGERWMLVRNPLKAITQDHCWIERGGQTWSEVLGATGYGGLAMYGNMPVLGAYYSMLMRCSDNPNPARMDEHSWLRHLGAATEARRTEPTDACRASFRDTFGIPLWLQTALETEYDSFDLKSVAQSCYVNPLPKKFDDFQHTTSILLKYY